MKKIFLALALVVNFAVSATFDDGLNAYKKGNFETAFIIWQDLANSCV